MRSRRFVAIAALAVLALGGYTVIRESALGDPCPAGETSVPADAVHLMPTLLQHQNWVGVDPPASVDSAGWIYACANGQVLGRKPVTQIEFDPVTGLAEIKILTRWVDLAWLSGDLDQYRDPARWTLVYTRHA